MSSMMRGSARSTWEASCSGGIVRRVVSLPRSILAGFSRVMGQGRELVGIGGRRNHHAPPSFPYQNPSNFPEHDPFNFPFAYPHDQSALIQEQLAFLDSFERQYGTKHPFFYACRFMDALKMAQQEQKFVFMYLHSPDHPFTPSFCRETLCSELVVQFLDANFVCWGAIANHGEGLQLAATLRASCFPFCAVVAPASGENMAVLQQMEGPVSPAELVEILQRTMEDQGLAFGLTSRAKMEGKRRADRRLREEQDAAYMAALKIDQEKEKRKNSNRDQQRDSNGVDFPNRSNHEKSKQVSSVKQLSNSKETRDKAQMQQKEAAYGGKDVPVTQILIRFPNGERREQSFLCTDKIQAIFRYIDSLGLLGTGNYRLISNFPRKVYGVDQMGMTLKDAGLHPKASLFTEHI